MRQRALFTLNLSSARRAWQNAKCRRENAKRPRRSTGEASGMVRAGPKEKEKAQLPGEDRRRKATRYAASGRIQPIGNQHRGLCNLSNCSLCYFLLSRPTGTHRSTTRPTLPLPRYFLLVFSRAFLPRHRLCVCRVTFREPTRWKMVLLFHGKTESNCK